jgi:hypothetical protein
VAVQRLFASRALRKASLLPPLQAVLCAHARRPI